MRLALAELDLENLQEALTTDGLPNTPAMRLQIAQAMLGAGKNEEARALLQALVKEDPNNAGARRLLAAFDKEKK